MSTNPNTVKSQESLNPCNDGKRSTEVLLSAIAELEKTKKQFAIALVALEEIKKGKRTVIKENGELVYIESWALEKIEELNNE